MNILIIKLGAIGDVLRTTGFLKGLFAKHASPDIYWITQEVSLPLLENNPYIKRSLILDNWGSISQMHFDIVLSLDDEEEACKVASEAKKETLYGAYLDPTGKRAYTKNVAAWFDMGLLGGPNRDDLKKANTRTYQEILSGILGIEASATKPILVFGKLETDFQEGFCLENDIEPGEKLVGINTGAGGRWRYKRLSEEKTAALIDAIHTTLGQRCILLGGPEERERNARILSLVSVPVIDAGTNHSLMDFCAIIGLCSSVVTSDSLAMHIATALEKKTVAFFGPTSSAEIDLFRRGIKITPHMTCLCCYKRTCDFNPVCMDLISIDRLVGALQELNA